MKSRRQLLRAAAGAAAQFLVTVLTSVAYGDERTAYLEFDNRMLWGTPSDKESADLSRFSEGNPVPAGTMSVQLFLNGNPRKMLDVYFKPVAGKTSAVACFTPIDIKSAGVALDKLPEDMVRWLQDSESKTTCKPIAEVVPSASAAFDFSEQRLDLTIPQAYLKELPADYIDPEQWERGITAARLNYTLDVFNSKSSGVNSTQGFGHFESGFNTLGWRLRNISSVTSSKHGNTFQAQRTYAQTDIEPIKSTLTLGQSFTDGQLLNSYGLQGAFLATDPRMLPSSLRNYAPVVSGVADSNAKVTIRQNGVVIYERAVPPGPFEIKNLQAVGYGNDLEVTVTEADGSEKKFSVPYSPLVQLLRPGQSKYSASVGEAWSPSFNNYKPLAGQFNYQYGVNNYLTASAGALVSEDYMAVALGGAVSTYIGGLSADYTHSNSRSDSTGAVNGDSLRFVYSTLIAPTNTNITLSSYRYSSQDYWSFNEFLSHENRRDKRSWKDPDFYYFYGVKQKGRFDISLRQRLPGALGNVSLRASTRNYWNREGTDTQYQLSYGNNFKSLSYNLSASRVKNQNNQQYDEFRLNISLPLSFSDYGRTYLSSTAWKHSESGSVGQLQLGGIAGADQQITYGVTTTQTLDNQNRQESYGVSGGYQGSNGYVTAGTSRGNGYQQSSLGVAGSVLAHSDGLTFGQTLGDTVALVEAKNGGGARITNASGAKVNGSGYGVVPYLTPYSRNRIELDPEGLSADIEFKHTSAESIPVDGSIVKIKFETTKESTLFIRATFADGSPLPFGAEVVDATSKNLVGYVGQAGGVVARGVGENSQLEVKLEKNHCVLELKVESESVNKNNPGAINNALGICKFE